MGEVSYNNQTYPFVQCLDCQSLYLDPMPDDETVELMYGLDYQKPEEESAHDFSSVIAFLRKQPAGVFIDYGCGKGEILREAKKLGWRPIGVELSEEVARAVSERTGVEVVQPGHGMRADVLHLGDVLEHLTKMDEQLPEILAMLKPGGYLIAQGPMEANMNLFTLAIRCSRRFRPKTIYTTPYHVMLATNKGQRALFARYGLKEVEYRLSEVSWPAPDKISANPRALGLYSLRKASQLVTKLKPSLGNRYFYVGRLLPDE